MKKKVCVTETQTYYFEIEVPDDADDQTIEESAHAEWGTNPSRRPDDYECDIEVQE